MREVLLGVGDFFLQVANQFIGFLRVELSDTDHAYLEEPLDILSSDFAQQLVFPWVEGTVHKADERLLVRCCLVPLLFVYALLDEDTFQAGEEQLFLQFGFLYFQFPLQQILGVVNRQFQQVTYRGEDWMFILDNAAVGRYIHLAVGESVQGVNRLVGRYTGLQLHHNAGVIGGEIVHFLHLDLAFLHSAQNGLDDFG